MKRILIGFLLLMGGWSPLFAQNFATANLTIAGTAPACLPTACVSLAVNQNTGGATFTNSGTWMGTVSFYGSGDGGVTLVALTVYPSNSATGVTTATGNGTWQVNPAGYTNLYAIFTTATSGTVVATIRSSVASARAGGGGGGGGGCTPSGSAGDVLLDSGSATCTSSADFVQTSHTLAGGASSIFDLSAATGTAAFKIPTNAGDTATAAGVFTYDTTNSNYHAYSGADSLVGVVPTASIPTTGHLIDALVASSKFILHDSGLATANVVNASSPGAGVAHFAGSTQTVTSSAVTPADATGNTTGSGNFVLVTSPTLVTPTLGAASATSVSSAAYLTATKCAATGTAASPSVVSCSAAPSGSFSCATNASTATCVIDDTIVTANSAIFIQPSAAAGSLLSVTCNTTADTGLTAPRLASISASTSFTINLGTFGTNPLCFNFFIIN